MDAFMGALIKMSLRGIVIVLIVLCVRLLLMRMQVSHKYMIGLWAMTFLYFIFPWKLALPVGFWNNAVVPEEIRLMIEDRSTADGAGIAGHTINIANLNGVVDNAKDGTHPTMPDEIGETSRVGEEIGSEETAKIEEMTKEGESVKAGGMVASMSANPAKQDEIGQNEREGNAINEGIWVKAGFKKLLGLLWLVGLVGLLGHMLYSYLAIRRKLLLSILFEDNIWWTEDIDIPMAFGLIAPQIYLPVSMEMEDLPYVVAHEKAHIRRKDGLFKMLAYVICLIHWFNPFVWVAYILLGSDMEKACDEEVIRRIGERRRKEYAYALLHMASGNVMRKKKVFVAPICFDEGNVRSRIRNIMKRTHTLPWIGSVAMVMIAAMSVLFLTEAKTAGREEPKQDMSETEGQGEEASDGKNPEEMEISADLAYDGEMLPTFYVEDLDALQIGENFSLEDYYITSRYTASNYYYVDEDGVLWGSGSNEYGQLGTGTYSAEEYHKEPVKIAEHVLSVDASWNDYFCIYLTEDGELYGVGLNFAGLLLGKGSESRMYSSDLYQRVTKPVLLMTDVSYARAGRECIVVIKTDRTAYWWGQYAPVTHTYASGGLQDLENYWKVEEDASNPVKMLAVEPMKVMERCRYITTGAFTGAAISEAGELFTWGFNVFGQCGTPVTEDDFVRAPVKVMDDVKMVWVDRIVFNDSVSQPSGYTMWETNYNNNTFVLMEDDALLAVGIDLGDKEKVTQMNGDLVEEQIHRYSDSFVPIWAVEYSTDYMLWILNRLEFGMSVEEVEEILSDSGLRTFHLCGENDYGEGYMTCLSALYNQYNCHFDSEGMLNRIVIQEGGSRDGRFTLGMSFADLEEAVREEGGMLFARETEASDTACWVYPDQGHQIQYDFLMYEGSVSCVSESILNEILGL